MSDGPESLTAPVATIGTLVPLRLVAIPLVSGLLAELFGWGVIAGAAPLNAGWYGQPSLLLGIHLVVIGGLLWPVVGAGWQLSPVVVATPLSPGLVRLAGRVGPTAVAGALLLWIGLGGVPWVGALGAALVIGALIARSAGLVPLLSRGLARTPGPTGAPGPGGSRRVAIRLWLLSAEACLWGGLGYAALLYAGKLGYPVLVDPIAGVGHHFALLAVGWIGGWEVGLGALLLPMFALGREPPTGAFLVAGLAWFGGVLLGSVVLWAFGAALAGGLLLLASRGGGVRVARGPGLAQARIALVGLLAVAAGAAMGVLTGPALVAGVAVAWLLPFQHGVALRVVPFLVWAHLLAGRSGSAPAALASARVGWAQVAATGVGGVLLVGGLAAGLEGVARAGAAALAMGAALHLVTVMGIGARAAAAWRAAVALPGTRARGATETRAGGATP
ncbi:MAG: hypothetical protein Q8P18_06345 [Pseudomonadota bacterium]|nr:hypothetical protein [Pseudomonadota bacterium]